MHITPTSQVSSYVQIQPIMAAMKTGNDKLPKFNTPISVEGTVIENKLHAVKESTLYNSHGIVTPNKPNSLVAYA